MTAFPEFYEVMRAILGDRQVLGVGWHYASTDLRSALRSVVALGRGPAGYALDAALAASTGITPDVAQGDPYALFCYDACLLLVGGEDGALSYQTRSMTVRDAGDRKRDLLWELREMVHEIRNGGVYFSTTQIFATFIRDLRATFDLPGDTHRLDPTMDTGNVTGA